MRVREVYSVGKKILDETESLPAKIKPSQDAIVGMNAFFNRLIVLLYEIEEKEREENERKTEQ